MAATSTHATGDTMSQDLQRLLADLQSDFELSEEFRNLEDDCNVWADWATSHAYNISVVEARGLTEFYNELFDDDLDMVAGGWSGNPGDGDG